MDVADRRRVGRVVRGGLAVALVLLGLWVSGGVAVLLEDLAGVLVAVEVVVVRVVMRVGVVVRVQLQSRSRVLAGYLHAGCVL